ncbi:(5-formylfuran-3-yl)methyl phosphate synthase [Botrimarina sp.]|uniref:(5-formylfuran-3-yl)methyl phosphate synthase n=1 Tax=Botrimarina sp. TaxID=2795802 RepID=UPI0032EF0428
MTPLTADTPTPPLTAGGAPRLLVSVRSPREALDALAGGAAIVDVKEPAAGPLGRAPDRVVAEVLAVVASRAPTTVALGELVDFAGQPPPPGAAVAKLGLAGVAGERWWRPFARAAAAIACPAGLAPVVYADAHAASGPAFSEAAEVAADVGSRWIVLDTYGKRGPSSLRLWGEQRIAEAIAVASGHGLRLVLAGGLGLHELPVAAALGPAAVGLRGAVCGGQRGGRLRRELVRQAALRLAPRPTIA